MNPLAFITTNLKLILFGVSLLAVCYGFYIVMDRADLINRVKNFEQTEAQNHERNETNETIRNSTDADKCELLGGMLADGQCQ